MKKENKEDQIKELETQVTCLYSLLKVEKESLYSREKEVRDLKNIEEARKSQIEVLKQKVNLLEQKDDYFSKYQDAKAIAQQLLFVFCLSLCLNILLAIVIFFK